ncbi:MAG: PhnD/SsuA/transferrin family substrate-binding protein [Gallionellaceae bacterium]|jgi:diguanylate cyclase (GGDEF)-like protein/PAS domain S-box-containing protein
MVLHISKHVAQRFLVQFICLTISLLLSIPASAIESIHIGVLAFRPKPQTLEQWQPLAVALKKAIPGMDFVVEAYTYPELEEATAGKHLDFVLTNPGHYVLLTKRIGLTAPLATLAVDDHGHASTEFGGVIFCRADQADIRSLSDVKGKTVAATSTDSLGGYQMQAYELSLKGITFPNQVRLMTTGMPHDNVVKAVLSGRAEIGFVRTGVLEHMTHEGKIDLSQIKILNLQDHPKFSQKVSTRLYPEWPFASLPSTDENIARHVAAALFTMEENTVATRAMGIHGFVVPSDYTPVSDLLKELRMPPFDKAPQFNLHDVWQRYLWQIVTILVAILAILLLGFRLIVTKRKLNMEHSALLLQGKLLKRSEAHLQTVIDNEPECIKTIDAQGRLVQMNPAGLAMIEANAWEQVSGLPVLDVIAPEYREAFAKMHKRVIAGESAQMQFEVVGLKGGRRWLETNAVPMFENGETMHLAITRDITQRKQMEERIHQLAYYDPLTNLPNRRLLNDRLGQAMALGKRTGCYGALMFLDLDNFKPLNDTYGHAVGDLLLIEVANRLKDAIREIDTVARFGGDEFVIMLSELKIDKNEATSQARVVAEKILASLAEPYLLTTGMEGSENPTVVHRCTVSIGVVIFIDHEDTAEGILKRGDAAMYQAKERGRNMICFYDSTASASTMG